MTPGQGRIAQEHPDRAAAFGTVPADSLPQPAARGVAELAWQLPAGLALIVSTLVAAWRYPLCPPVFVLALGLYVAILWRWPRIWLIVLPAVLPTFDLTPWTGWYYVAEADLLILATIGALLILHPPELCDLRVPGFGAAVLLLLVGSQALAVARGLFATPALPDGSDNPYLRPENALRLAKGLIEALILLPFLRQSLRQERTAILRLAAGFTVGLALEGLAVIVERGTFLGIFDFTSGYRVVGTFSSMHVGGGFIDDYFVMCLPFVALCASLGGRRAWPVCAIVASLALYGLVVTFSRTAYAAIVAGATVLAFGLWAATRRSRVRPSRGVLALGLTSILIAIGISIVGFDTEFMRARLERSISDISIRERNLLTALDVRDRGVATTLLGMGLGSYPRAVRRHDGIVPVPTNFVLHRDADGAFLSIAAGTALYLGQKVPIKPYRRYRLSLTLRSYSGTPLTALLCEKLLLYSIHCRVAQFDVASPGDWETRTVMIDSDRVGAPVVLKTLPRPVELTLLNSVEATTLDVRNVSLLDPEGRELLVNGDFGEGMSRWYFTDDEHLGWRIDNQFVMIFFEGGALGLIALALLLIAAIAGALKAAARGQVAGAVVIASLAGTLVCCVFDAPLQDPRLAVLFYLTCLLGIALPGAFHERGTRQR